MTRRILKEEPADVDVFESHIDETWTGILRDIDALFAHLSASPTVRSVVVLRLQGHSISEIASRMDTDGAAIRVHLRHAGRMLIHSGILNVPLGEGIHSISDRVPLKQVGPPTSRDHPLQAIPKRKRIWNHSRQQRRPGQVTGRKAAYQNLLCLPGETTSHSAATGEANSLQKRTASRSISRGSSLRPLTPVQSFGWRDVYQAEVHRYGLRK